MPKWHILGCDILLPFIINSKIHFWCHYRKTPPLYLHPTLTPILLPYCIMMWPPFCPPSLQVSCFLQWPRALSMWHHKLSFPQKGKLLPSNYYPHFPDEEMRLQKVRLGIPWWRSGWESACQCGGHGFEPWSGKIPHAAEQLGPWATITEPARLEPVLRNKRGHDNERPAHRDEEWPPLAATRESPRTETKTQHSHK